MEKKSNFIKNAFAVASSALSKALKKAAVLGFSAALLPLFFLNCASFDKDMEKGLDAIGGYDYKNAVKYFTKAVGASKRSDESEQALSYKYRARAYAGIEDYENAIKDYKTAIANGDRESVLEIGKIYTLTGDNEEALQNLNDYINNSAGRNYAKSTAGASDISAFIYRGDVYFNMGDAAKAKSEYDKGIAMYNDLIKNKLNSGDYGNWTIGRNIYADITHTIKSYRAYFNTDARMAQFSVLIMEGSFLLVRYFDNNTVRNWSDAIVLIPPGKHTLDLEKKYQYSDKMTELLREVVYGTRTTPIPIQEEDVQAVEFAHETVGGRVIITALTEFTRDFVPLHIYRLSSALEIIDELTLFYFSDITLEEGL